MCETGATHEDKTSDQSHFSRMSRESRAKNIEIHFTIHASRVLRMPLADVINSLLEIIPSDAIATMGYSDRLLPSAN
jgi:hypothetical protein